MDIVNALPESTWKSYVRNHPHGNIFHTPEMFQVFSQTKGHSPELWAALDRESQPLALFMPVRVSIVGGLLMRMTTRAVSYGSVLCNADNRGREALAVLLEAYKRKIRRRVLFTELRNVSDLRPLQPVLDKAGFAFQEHINFLVDLNCSKSELMDRLGRRTRKHIRSALKNRRVVIEEVGHKNDVKTCFLLLNKSYRHAGVYLADQSLFETAFKVLHSKGMVRFLLARVDGRPVATSIELLYKDTITGWYGGIDREFSRYNPNELLTWHIFAWGIDNQYRQYDFGGAGDPAEEYGVRDFKAKFKGERVRFGRNVCVHTPGLLLLSKLGYRVYQHIRSINLFGRREIEPGISTTGENTQGHQP